MWDLIGAAFLIGLAAGVLLTGAGRVNQAMVDARPLGRDIDGDRS